MNLSHRTLKKSDVSDLLVIGANHSFKKSDVLKKFVFFVCFDSFPPFLCPRAKSSRHSSLICSLLKSNLKGFTLAALYKSATVSDRFAQFAHDKRASKSDLLRSLMTKE